MLDPLIPTKPVEVTTVWEEELVRLEESISKDTKKYPLTEREQILYNTLRHILQKLHQSTMS